MIHRCWQRTTLWLFVALVVTSAALACDNTPHDKLADGKQALADRDLDRAQERLGAALEADPQLVEARRLLATTYLRDHQFQAAEQMLEELWEDEGYDREADLSANQRQTRQLMSEQFGDLYRQWARSVDRDDDPEKFEDIARRGLQRNSRDGTLNTMLVEFYDQRANRFVERGEPVRAAEMLERIDELHRFPDTRRESRQQARQLRRQAFGDEARQRFESDLQPELVEADAYTYDLESETITIATEQPLERRLDSDDRQAVEQVRNTAVQTLVPTLSQFAVSMSGLEADEVNTAGLEVPRLKLIEEDFRPGQYEMNISIALSELVDMAFEIAERVRTDADVAHPDDRSDLAGQHGADGESVELDTTAVDEP